MGGTTRTGLRAVVTLGFVVPMLAATLAPVRAEVAASELLTWCGGANQSGQLGAINAFRCVNYLQGTADMVRALSGADLDTCLSGGESAGAQLMARFVPDLKARASEEDVDATPMARHVADWLQHTCEVELTLASDGGAGQDQADALAEAQADAAAYAEQVAALQATLEVAVTGQNEELAACTATVDDLQADLAATEAQAADFGMQVTELALELEAGTAEAIARRQDIAEAEERIAALVEELDAALAAKRSAEQALADARSEIEQRAAQAEDGAAEGAGEQIDTLEAELAEADVGIAALEEELAANRASRQELAAELQRVSSTSGDRAERIAALEQELASCRVDLASAEPPSVPAPPETPSRPSDTPAPPPTSSIVTSPGPDPGASPNTGAGTSNITRAEPRPLDAIGIQALRQMQQAALRQSAVGQRSSWSTPDARYSGHVVVLREGYDGPDFCREIYSEARSSGSVVHQRTDLYCRSDGLWIYIPPGR